MQLKKLGQEGVSDSEVIQQLRGEFASRCSSDAVPMADVFHIRNGYHISAKAILHAIRDDEDFSRMKILFKSTIPSLLTLLKDKSTYMFYRSKFLEQLRSIENIENTRLKPLAGILYKRLAGNIMIGATGEDDLWGSSSELFWD